jgi:iron complex outermembrane recepter protein
MRFSFKQSLVGASLLALSVPAYAQDAPAEEGDESDIVVTGTLVRGIAPAGTNVITANAKAIEETGVSSVAQLLQTIPQVGTFNDLQTTAGGSSFVTTNRPNLRNLPGFTTAGSSPTLVLVDGHRVVGAGISVTDPDADIVPPGMIERVEIVPDGGSAIYGSDAVAGVINFITKKKFDGVDVDASYGFADGYHSFDANATIGKTWDRGSVFISYNYAEHSELNGRDRDWVFYPLATINGAPGGGSVVATNLRCSPGNVSVGFVGDPTTAINLAGAGFYGLTANGVRQATLNQCDPSDDISIYPKERRHSLMAGANFEFSDAVELDLRGFYTNRKTETNGGPFDGSVNFGPAFLAQFGFIQSPLFAPNSAVTGTCPTDVDPGPGVLIFNLPCNTFEAQQVFFKFGPQGSVRDRNELSTWGVTPTLTAKLGDNWRAKLLGSYGESTVRLDQFNIDATAINNAATAGLFNPYNPSASNTAALAVLSNLQNFNRVKQSRFNTRLVIDGDLLQLPGGAIKAAFGAEYDETKFNTQFSLGSIVPGTENSGSPAVAVNGTTIVAAYGPARVRRLGRNVKSVFGEIVVPIFGADNATAGLRELTLSLAGRFDDYSDFGGTFNPKIGVTWKPTDWVRLRGAWGKSFVAPSLADFETAAPLTVNFVNIPFLLPSAALVGTTINGVVVPPVNNRSQIVLQGNQAGIVSEKATTWSLGADIDVPGIDGLRLSGTYYNIDFKNIFGLPPFTTSTFYQNFVGTKEITFLPTQAQVDALIAKADRVNGTSCAANCYVIVEARKTNLSQVKLSGIDLSLNYIAQTGFGSLDFNFSGNIDLTRDQQSSAGLPFVDQINNNASNFRFRTALGAQIQQLRAQVTWNHRAGYNLVPSVGVGTTQSSVASFNTVDLYFKYEFADEGVLGGLALSLKIDNVFDQDPPRYLLQNDLSRRENGYTNGRTIGRYVQFGIAKKF